MKKLLVVLFCVLASCNNTHKDHTMESPLATVVKLIAAESFADFNEAKKYIDLDKVYSNHPDTVSAEQAWKNQVMFFYNIGKDKKFTNNFKYYDYIIKEVQKGESADVVFEAISNEESINKITYKLVPRNNAWIVIKIDYQKK